ncbi:hypothetical protein CASFOL_026815 [Castilleja foliolosa]|uniref:WAT1-related protein n=1 Tax=Castilleja foliolosa TaxID=1961234 RepID=A0ABD3CI51_9LAMI
MRSMGKIIGTVVCVSGAAGMALFKGPKLLNLEFQTTNSILLGSNGRDTWLIGCLFLIGSSCAWSTWLILQVHVSAFYPDHLSLTAWMCLFAALQSGILTFIVEPNANSWKLNSPLQFFCCFYAGLASAFTYFAQAWCISKRGPLFSAMFNPLLTLIITLLACLFLHEVLYTGSLIGGLAVIIGLYIVLWGKAKDHQDNNEGEKSSHKEKQNDETTLSTQVSECSIDLEEPLLPETSAN